MSDASEADLQEQEVPVADVDDLPSPAFEPEVPEADAVEQALPAPLDDDDRR